MNNHLSFEEGWKVLEQGIVKCSKILECTSTRPTVNEYMNYYDCAYRMAVQKQHYCPEMYNGFKMMLAECVRTMVLPHLMHKQNDSFFRELVKMWSNYCIMIRCVIGFFSYLDRCYVKQYKLPSLSNTAATSFFDPVFSYFNDEARTALLTMIQQERDGIRMDSSLRDVMHGICCSEAKSIMQNAFLDEIYGYYSVRSSEWIKHYSLPDYLAKVEESMEMETKRLAYYLEISSGDSYPLCLQAVNAPLMETYVSYVTEKQIGGQLMLETYKIVEEELLGRCSSLTLG
ncbi:cullin-1 [Zea mays]|uniref:Cullin-1 n=1 Tax=Zea mays TaxID=4577 RepID=B6T5W1_MAIZE|nr:cullin-1 [Zea mays]NP_001399032.1 cullin-1 [Zea mays]ACG32494.1 cullin-1 [Zea mays]ACG32905.1 cullin-1 [Zea mays]ONM34776.1 Putative cullin-like protein 2 [Zea mays]ONM34777.1 Putative cullin-like protein 2 [Zea mays]|eukprot:NP_001148676.1 cullin-1 [Zea mays]